MSKWIPRKKGEKPTGSDDAKKRPDRIDSGKRKSPPGKGGDSRKNNRGGTLTNRRSGDLSMTNNISSDANKQPVTITALSKAKSEYFKRRVQANKELRAAIRERNALIRESRKLKKQRLSREQLLQAQRLLGNQDKVEELSKQVDRISKAIRSNGHKRGGLSRTISHREEVVTESEYRRSAIDEYIDKLREQRKRRKRKRTKGIPKSHERQRGIPKTRDVEPEEAPAQSHPFPTEVQRGGDILIDDAAQEPVRHDHGIAPDNNAYIAAGVTYSRVAESAAPTPFHETMYQQNLADVIHKADDAGLTFEHNGQEIPISEALMHGADPQQVWTHIKDNFDGGTDIEKIPYKGILDLR